MNTLIPGSKGDCYRPLLLMFVICGADHEFGVTEISYLYYSIGRFICIDGG